MNQMHQQSQHYQLLQQQQHQLQQQQQQQPAPQSQQQSQTAYPTMYMNGSAQQPQHQRQQTEQHQYATTTQHLTTGPTTYTSQISTPPPPHIPVIMMTPTMGSQLPQQHQLPPTIPSAMWQCVPVPPNIGAVGNMMSPRPLSLQQTLSAVGQMTQQSSEHVIGLCDQPGTTSTLEDCNLDSLDTKKAENTLTQEYRTDFEEFKRMNLVDDKDHLNKIYCSLHSFNNPGALCSLLVNLYMQKYYLLYKKYIGLESFTIFVMMGIISRKSVDEFKLMVCNSSVVANNLVTVRAPTISRYAMMKAARAGGSSDNRPTSAPINKRPKLTGKPEPVHPLMKTPLFINKRILLYLGEIHTVLMPIEFAPIKSSLTLGPVKLYEKIERTVNGAVMKTTVPMLLRVSVPTIIVKSTNQTYYDITDADRVLNFVNAGLDRDVSRLNFSMQKNQKWTSLKSGSIIADEGLPDIETLYVIANGFDFSTAENNDMNGWCSSEKNVAILTSDRKTFTETVPDENVDDHIINTLDDYDRKCEEYMTATSSTNGTVSTGDGPPARRTDRNRNHVRCTNRPQNRRRRTNGVDRSVFRCCSDCRIGSNTPKRHHRMHR